ncbi:MAG: hypothetical protein WAZ77_17445 [Candidatus Nitrosopolaris sp.]
MNHNKTTLAIASIVVAVALAGVAFATPQQVLAGGHHNHKDKSNSVKVDQQINQQNACSTPTQTPPPPPPANNSSGQPLEHSDAVDTTGSSSSTICLNSGNNSADIHK